MLIAMVTVTIQKLYLWFILQTDLSQAIGIGNGNGNGNNEGIQKMDPKMVFMFFLAD